MKKIAVVLSGCGVFDGAEIIESVLTLLAIETQGACYQCLAPNIEQAQVVNHLTQKSETSQKRNVLEESARIARGNIIALSEARPDDYDAAIFPGGFGAAKNLCDFAFKGAECTIDSQVIHFVKAMHSQRKPQGFICIAPAMLPGIFGKGVQLTIGNDVDTAATLTRMGAEHSACAVDGIVVDEKNQVVTTPAYMLAQSIVEAQSGINKLVSAVIQRT